MSGRRSIRGLRGVLERRRAELDEQAGAKSEREEGDVDWPLERDDPPEERSHPGARDDDEAA